MFLKSITLSGFKSFATRTTLELGEGVTVVVGPNGAGKSNIIDAIAWATGGQSTRTLRAVRSEDLLFSGSATLRPSSRAEVTLVFDNSSGLLPIDRPEVSITRRCYRSGESEFEINRTSCRLLDITELLAEAGLRKSRYAMVGQGQVDQILNASPVEHRRALEEAAGVGKHLWRRDRAIRRLEATRSDLDRIEDLIAEKKRRLRPLRRQAKALARYSRLGSEIAALQLYLEGDKLREVDALLATEGQNRTRWETSRSEALAERERLLAVVAEAESAREALGSRSATRTLDEWKVATERLRRLAEVADLRAQARRRHLQGEARRRLLVEEKAGLDEALAGMGSSMETLEAQVRSCRDSVTRLTRRESELSALRPGDVALEMAFLNKEQNALVADAKADEEEAAVLDGRIGELSAAAAAADRQVAETEGLVAEMEVSLRGLQGDAEDAARRVRDRRRCLEDAEGRLRQARTAAAAALGRLEAARAGAGGGASDAGDRVRALSGWKGWVDELWKVPSDLAAAVDAALEKWRGAAVFEGPVALGNAAEKLAEKSRAPSAVSIVSARIPGEVESPARTVAASGSDVTPLIDLLGADGGSALAARLLGDAVLVSDWRSGWEVVSNHPALRAVTRAGDVISIRGILVGGSERLPDMGALSEEAEDSVAGCDVLESEVAAMREEVRSLEELREEVFRRLDAQRRRLLELQRRLDGASLRRREIERQVSRLHRRREGLAGAHEERADRRAEIEQSMVRLERSRPDAEEERRRLGRLLDETSGARLALGKRQRELTTELTRLGERRRMHRTRVEQIEKELTELALLPVVLPEDHAGDVAEMAARALGILSVRKEAVVESHRRAKRRDRRLAKEVSEARRSLGHFEEVERRATGELERIIAEASRLEARRQMVLERIEEMDASVEDALGAAVPDTEDPAGALASLVAEMERMRPINHYAADDLSVVEEELSELSFQHDDIVMSGRELGKVIGRLEREATERYLATFRETAAAFEQTFGQLFPGGRGRLRMVDRSDPLGSGVEIRAQPLGKRVTRLSLLSGGERAMGALAFLFALIRTRPCPFYLLDEVDATLDSVNLHRVLEMVADLSTRAQILVITHHPQTAEVGDVLYGVTLPPGGTTRVVSRRMDRRGLLAGLPNPQARSA